VNTGDIGGILVWCILHGCYTCIRESKPRQWSTLDFFSDWHNDDRPRKRQLWTPPVGNLPGLLPHWYLSHSNYGCRRLGICLSFLSWLDDLFAPMGCHRLGIYPSSAYDRTRRGQRRKDDVPVWNLSPSSAYYQTRRVNDGRAMSRFGNLPPVVPTTGLAEVNDARAMSRSGNLLPGSACDQTRRG
jgi:hypothetical protein